MKIIYDNYENENVLNMLQHASHNQVASFLKCFITFWWYDPILLYISDKFYSLPLWFTQLQICMNSPESSHLCLFLLWILFYCSLQLYYPTNSKKKWMKNEQMNEDERMKIMIKPWRKYDFQVYQKYRCKSQTCAKIK